MTTGTAPQTTPSPFSVRRRAGSVRPRSVGPGRRALDSQRGVPQALGRHNVRIHRTGTKAFHHPVVGDLTLTYEMLELSADSGLAIMAYTAEPGSKSAEALDLLASWTATIDVADAATAAETASQRSPGASPLWTMIPHLPSGDSMYGAGPEFNCGLAESTNTNIHRFDLRICGGLLET